MAINNSCNLPPSTSAQTKTGTSTAVAVTPASLGHGQGECKAWVVFAGSNGAVSDSYNVTSVTRNSTGNYTVNLSITMTNATYVTVPHSTGAGVISNYGTLTTTTAVILTNNIVGLGIVTPIDPTTVSVAIFGQF